MSQADYIPQNPLAFVVWFTKFILHLQALSPKYELCSEKVETLLNDHEWVHQWAWVRSDVKEQEKSLNRLFETSSRDKNGERHLTAPLHEVSDALTYIPDNLLPAIKERVRELVECIKSQRHIYTVEDGSLLGILTPEEAGWIEEDYTPDLKFRPLADYCLEVDFRKFGLDAIRVEYRYIWGEWQFGGFLHKSPDVIKIPPPKIGLREQIEIRAVFWDENRPFGNWSPVYRMIITP